MTSYLVRPCGRTESCRPAIESWMCHFISGDARPSGCVDSGAASFVLLWDHSEAVMVNNPLVICIHVYVMRVWWCNGRWHNYTARCLRVCNEWRKRNVQVLYWKWHRKISWFNGSQLKLRGIITNSGYNILYMKWFASITLISYINIIFSDA